MASRRSTPGLYDLLLEADLGQFYNELRSSLRVCHVQQLKDVNEDDLGSIGMTRSEAQRLKTYYNKYCPPNYVTKLKKEFSADPDKYQVAINRSIHTKEYQIRI